MQSTYSQTITFRVTKEQKGRFEMACGRSEVFPTKYNIGNKLREFVVAYAKNPRVFDEIFHSELK